MRNVRVQVCLGVFLIAGLLSACARSPRTADETTASPLPPTEAVRAAEATARPTSVDPTPRPTATAQPSPTATSEPPTEAPTATPDPTSTPAPTEVPPEARYDPAALELVALFNQWRVREGRWPLRLNDTLTEMAQDQAAYVVSLPSIPYGATIHLDANGLEEKARALRYGWPHYRTDQQIAVGEIAATGHAPQDALNFWLGSEIHRNISMSDAFREVGAAVVPFAGGKLYVIVVGARPGVLPALVDVETQQVYLTSERYRWAAAGDWMQAVTRVQLVTSEAGPAALEAWREWSPAVTPPEDNEPPFFVALSDGLREVVVRAAEGRGGLWFPPSAAAVPPPTEPPAPDTATPAPGIPPTPTRTPVPPPTTTPDARRDVLLVYDGVSLTLLNVSGGPLDLTSLVLAGSSGDFPVTRWQTEWLGAPLGAFPDRHCLQVWGFGDADPARPVDCISRSSAIYMSRPARFWLEGEFDVRQGGAVLATCRASAGFCEVNLP